MPARFGGIDEGPDITLDRAMVVVGRHPSCDTRIDSLRVSRHHCCMTQENGEVMVRDLGDTNLESGSTGKGFEIGRIRAGDELSIAHIRYRLGERPGARTDDRRVGGSGNSGPRPRRRSNAVWPTSTVGGGKLRSEVPAKMPLRPRVRKLLPNPALLISVGFKSLSRWRATVAPMKRSQFPWGRVTTRRTPPNVIPTHPPDQGDCPFDRVAAPGPLDRSPSRV